MIFLGIRNNYVFSIFDIFTETFILATNIKLHKFFSIYLSLCDNIQYIALIMYLLKNGLKFTIYQYTQQF